MLLYTTRSWLVISLALLLGIELSEAQTPPKTPAAKPDAFAPFAVDPKFTAKMNKAPVFHAFQSAIPVTNAAAWKTVGDPITPGASLITATKADGKDALQLVTREFDPGVTLVASAVTDEAAKSPPGYVSFSCKSTKGEARLNVYLLRGKVTEGSGVKFAVPVSPGAWQKVILPVTLFSSKPLAHIDGIGFGVNAAPADSDILLSDINIGATASTAETLKAKVTNINLAGLWRFAPDSADQGLAQHWNAPDFNDSAWQLLKSGMAWQPQGVTLSGWGWYRQQVVLPAEAAGTPLTLVLAEFPYDDDVYVNGTRIGGLVGNYPYSNLMRRVYTAPASLLKYGEPNTIAIRVWGIDGSSTVSSTSGLTAGLNPRLTYYLAQLDPYATTLRVEGGEDCAQDHFDLSPMQQGTPFEITFRFPAELAKNGGTLNYVLTDFYGQVIQNGTAPLVPGTSAASATVKIDAAKSKAVYLAGRVKAYLTVCDSAGVPVTTDLRELDRFSFAQRDAKALPALSAQEDETPYGKLKLVDEIDCATPIAQDLHPFMQSAMDSRQNRNTPGAAMEEKVTEILGRKARECDYGWFAYRIGRGKLVPHHNYLLRIEYPEDKTRYVPIEIQNGHNFIDVGWKNGISKDNPYDNWPLSHAWQWYDTVVALDEETTGTSGTGGASAENGFWVYFMNKQKPGRYFGMYEGGPAVGRMRLYEIDPEKNAPVITRPPKDVPQRVLMVDWERQADQVPEDIVRYCKLMGYSAVSPIMLKWAFMNYGDPLSGYETTNLDGHRYWVKHSYQDEEDEAAPATAADETPAAASDPAPAAEAGDESTPEAGGTAKRKPKAAAPVPVAAPKPSVHRQYLAMTKKWGIDYVPRIEYGGSQDLPIQARALGGDGELAKPNRFATWGADLLHPATWDDLARTVESYFKPFVKDNPQLTGMLWRIRSDRMQVSYSRGDVTLFSKETSTPLPAGMNSKQLAGWASTGEVGKRYADWWHEKREKFHAKLVELLRSYRPDLTVYYFNWDADKFALGLRDMNTASTFVEMVGARYGLTPEVYARHVRDQQSHTSEDYIQMIRTGQLTDWPGWGADYGLHMELYKDLKGFEILAPVNSLYTASDPKFLAYFQTGDGLAVSNVVSYDETASRTLNPKFEGHMVLPGGAPFSMALELLSYFNGDARTLTYTVYTYGRGFADAHRRFAQAFLALPATEGTVIDQGDPDVKARLYPTSTGTYAGIAYKGYHGKKLPIKLTGTWKPGAKVKDLVTGKTVDAKVSATEITFEIDAAPMQLDAFLIQ